MIFDGPIPYDEFVASIVAKLHRVPRYQQVVVMPPLNIGLPTWEDDPHFDIRRHVFRAALKPPGGEAELEALVGGIFSQLLDRSKPLWEIHVVHGLKDGRGALIWRLHHALADGVSGTRLLELLLDPTPEGSPALSKPCPPLPQPSNGVPAGGISGVVQTTLDRLIATESGLLGFAQAVLGDPKQEGSKSLLDVLPELLVSVERLPFNKPCGEGRKFCWAEFDMAEVKAIREALGGRVNDVILTMLTRALACYVKLHGQSIVKRFVRIVCPVSLRKPGQEESLGNQISFMPVALPMDVQDPAEMLRAVAARTETMKRSGAAALVGVMAGCIAKAPTSLQALFWWGLPELILPVPLFNLICTNVPGPPIPLYAVGKRMIAAYPQVPTGYDLGVNVAVESYDGKLFFGLVADAQVASDVNRLRDFLYDSFQELRQAARKKAPAATKQPRRRSELTRRPRIARKQPLKTAETISPVVAATATAGPPATRRSTEATSREAARSGRSAREQPAKPAEAVALVTPEPAMEGPQTTTPSAPAREIENAA
jgi:diacylglycerol O-acyltransferase